MRNPLIAVHTVSGVRRLARAGGSTAPAYWLFCRRIRLACRRGKEKSANFRFIRLSGRSRPANFGARDPIYGPAVSHQRARTIVTGRSRCAGQSRLAARRVKGIFIADYGQGEIHLFCAACNMVPRSTCRNEIAPMVQANAGTRSRQGIWAHPAWESIVR
jgi:hypothetical protein